MNLTNCFEKSSIFKYYLITMTRSRWKVLGSWDPFWHFDILCSYMWFAWVSLAWSGFPRSPSFQSFARVFGRFLAEFAQLLKVAEISSPLPARNSGHHALQWFHRSEVWHFSRAHLAQSHLVARTTPINVNNSFGGEWAQDKPSFVKGKRVSKSIILEKKRKCIFLWCSSVFQPLLFDTFRVFRVGRKMPKWFPNSIMCHDVAPDVWRLIKKKASDPLNVQESWWSLAFWVASRIWSHTTAIQKENNQHIRKPYMLIHVSIFLVILLMAEILHHLGWCWNPINNGKNYQPQLVQDFIHQQYLFLFLLGKHPSSWI